MKRFISIFLSAIIVLSLIPAASAVTEPQSYHYVFNYYAHNDSGTTALSDAAQTVGDTNTEVSNGRWGFAGTRYTADGWMSNRTLSAYDNRIQWAFNLSEEQSQTAEPKAPSYNPDDDGKFPVFLLELEVPDGGTYRPTLEYIRRKSSSVVELFLIKGDADKLYTDESLTEYAKSIDPATRLGKVDLAGTNGTEGKTSFPAVTLEAGTYYLVFIANGFNGTADFSTYLFSNNHLTGFRLDAAKGNECTYNLTTEAFRIQGKDGVEAGDATAMPVTTTKADRAKAGIGAWNSNGTYYIYDMTSATAEYTDETKSDAWSFYKAENNYAIFIEDKAFWMTGEAENFVEGSWPYAVFKLEIPSAGKYQMSFDGYAHANSTANTSLIYGADANIYVLPVTDTEFSRELYSSNSNLIGQYKFYEATSTVNNNYIEKDPVTFDKTIDVEKNGEYYVVVEYRNDNGAKENANARGSSKMTEGDTEYADYYGGRIKSITLTNLGLTDAEIKTEQEKIFNPENASEKAVTLTSESAEIKLLSMDITSSEGSVEDTLTAEVGSAQSVTADEISGKQFLYWMSGIGTNRRVVSDTEIYNFTAEKGLTYLTAVYRDVDSDKVQVKFINGNGELVNRSDVTYTAGTDITMPTLPTMTGFGTASGWQLAGTEDIYREAVAVKASGKEMIFVAQYEDTNDTIDITVQGGTMTVENGKDTPPVYGDKVTVTANSREGGSGYNVFAYWTKTVNGTEQIVSLDKEYSFNAWEDCTVTAVYTEVQIEPIAAQVRKILLGTIASGTETANVAEFIGCDGAIERGILYGTDIENCSNKIAMTTSKNHLTVINDSENSARAYAIFSDGVIYSE